MNMSEDKKKRRRGERGPRKRTPKEQAAGKRLKSEAPRRGAPNLKKNRLKAQVHKKEVRLKLMYAFREAYATLGNGAATCDAIGIKYDRYRTWCKNPERYPEWDEIYKDAQERFGQWLESHARQRATEGVRQYKFDKSGKPLKHPEQCVCEHHISYHDAECLLCPCEEFEGRPYFEDARSDALLKFMLESNLEKYRRRMEKTVDMKHSGDVMIYLPDNKRGRDEG